MKLTADVPSPTRKPPPASWSRSPPGSSQHARPHLHLINYPILFKLKATAAEYKAGLDLAIERGWLELHESGTYLRLRQLRRLYLGERSPGEFTHSLMWSTSASRAFSKRSSRSAPGGN